MPAADGEDGAVKPQALRVLSLGTTDSRPTNLRVLVNSKPI